MSGSGVHEFLNAGWVAHLDERVRDAPELRDAAERAVAIEARVVDHHEVVAAYHLVLGPGPARAAAGSASSPDLVLIATIDAARGIHAGTTNAQRCLADGSLRLRGNPEVLTRHVTVLAGVADLFVGARR